MEDSPFHLASKEEYCFIEIHLAIFEVVFSFFLIFLFFGFRLIMIPNDITVSEKTKQYFKKHPREIKTKIKITLRNKYRSLITLMTCVIRFLISSCNLTGSD